MAVGHLVTLGGKKSKRDGEEGGNVFRAFIVFLRRKKKTEEFVESSWTLGSYPWSYNVKHVQHLGHSFMYKRCIEGSLLIVHGDIFLENLYFFDYLKLFILNLKTYKLV